MSESIELFNIDDIYPMEIIVLKPPDVILK